MKKVEKRKAPDIEVLHPERMVKVGGREVTVREYGFVEGLRLQQDAAPIVDRLVEVATGVEEAALDKILDILAESPKELLQLIAQAADVEVEFLETLSDTDGQVLMMVWWMVNSNFFMMRMTRRIAIQKALKKKQEEEQALVGGNSTSASSTTAIASTG